MSDRPSSSDIRHDAMRTYPWPEWIGGWVAGLITVSAIWILDRHVLSEGWRLFWLLAPVPALIAGIWISIRQGRRRDEFERALWNRAAAIAFWILVVVLVYLAVLEAAFGLPLMIPAPGNLPPDRVDFRSIAMLALMLHMCAFVLVHRRAFPK